MQPISRLPHCKCCYNELSTFAVHKNDVFQKSIGNYFPSSKCDLSPIAQLCSGPRGAVETPPCCGARCTYATLLGSKCVNNMNSRQHAAAAAAAAVAAVWCGFLRAPWFDETDVTSSHCICMSFHGCRSLTRGNFKLRRRRRPFTYVQRGGGRVSTHSIVCSTGRIQLYMVIRGTRCRRCQQSWWKAARHHLAAAL